MRYGFRRPNLRKSFKSRTTGRITRTNKKLFNPYYGKSGRMGMMNPKKAMYNRVYYRTTRPVYSNGHLSDVFNPLTISILIIIIAMLILL